MLLPQAQRMLGYIPASVGASLKYTDGRMDCLTEGIMSVT